MENIAESSKHSNLYLRILTASVGLPGVLALVYLASTSVLRLAFLCLVVRTAYEFARLVQPQSSDYPSYAWQTRCLIITAFTFFTASSASTSHSMVALLATGIIAAAIFGTLGQISVHKRASSSLNALFVVTYPVLTWLAIWLLAEKSRDMLALVLVSAWVSDSGAFFIGRRWGKHKMAPDVSPHKTWEGAAAGFTFSIVATFLFELYRSPVNNWFLFLYIAPASAFAAQIGDLFKSIFKRQAGGKDAGMLLPGHGGLIDRVDSVLLSGVVIWALLIFLH